ncbi:MAG: hypothetical protein ACPGVO_03365 [Spirulinaceae cyanobacterium]
MTPQSPTPHKIHQPIPLNHRLTRLLLGMMGGTIFLLGCASPEPSAQSAQPETPEVPATSASAASESSVGPTTAPQTALAVADILGQWTSEGDVTATHLTNIEIVDYEGEINGTIEATAFEDGSRSPVLSLVGRPGEKIVDIYDQRGHYVGTAELELDGEVLTFRLIDGETEFESSAEEILPAIAYHTRVNG